MNSGKSMSCNKAKPLLITAHPKHGKRALEPPYPLLISEFTKEWESILPSILQG